MKLFVVRFSFEGQVGFDLMTEQQSERDPTYFQYYAQLVHQQNMLQDSVRTSIYYGSIIGNPQDFLQKSVMGNI
jgi:hypothetical protein